MCHVFLKIKNLQHLWFFSGGEAKHQLFNVTENQEFSFSQFWIITFGHMEPKGHVQPWTVEGDSEGYLDQHLLVNPDHTPNRLRLRKQGLFNSVISALQHSNTNMNLLVL